VESSRAQIEQTKAALKLAETNLRYTTIRSPVNGIVISRNVDVGQTVAASLQAPTLFTIAKDLTQMQVDANVSEADIGRVETGQEATFSVDAYPEQSFRGKVSEIRNAPTTIQNVVTYDVVIHVENKDLKLKPGMTANVSVLIAHREGVLKIPNAALRLRLESAKTGGGVEKKKALPEQKNRETMESQDKEGRPGRVWILSQEGKPASVPILVGITDGTFSEVGGGDLRDGMEVIVEDMSKKKGQPGGATPPIMRGMGR
jgi:HlyD family secretion protein